MGLFDRLTEALIGQEVLPPGVRERLELAAAYADRGDAGEAARILDELAAEQPRLPAVWRARGELRRREGDLEAAVAAFGRAVDLGPGDAQALLGLGEVLLGLGRTEPAEDAFRRALAVARDRRDEARAHAGRGRTAAARRDWARAARELALALTEPGFDPGAGRTELEAALGRAQIASGNPEGAVWLGRAARRPGAPAALVAEAARAQTRPDAAVDLLANALATPSPDDNQRAVLHATHAEALVAAGRPAEAEAALRRAQEMPPETLAPAARAAVERARRQLATAQGAWTEACAAAEAERAAGGTVPWPVRLTLALGARDRAPLSALLADRTAEVTRAADALAAWLNGAPSDDDLVTLATFAGDAGTRRFVAGVRARPAPAGDLAALLAYGCELALQTPELTRHAPALLRAQEAYAAHGSVDRPLRVAVVGEFSAGKSSFVNALAQGDVAAVGVTPTTATLNLLRFGPDGARVVFVDGRTLALPRESVVPFLTSLSDSNPAATGVTAAGIRQVEIFAPLPLLRTIEILDTPGLNSVRPEHEALAREALVEADALIWVFSAHQAAKASERDALALAHEAGQRVLAILNKAEAIDDAELPTLVAEVKRALGDRIAALVPFSARRARRDGAAGDERARVLAAIDEVIVAHAPALKRRAALFALQRFVRAATASPPATAATETALAPVPLALENVETQVRAALASERLQLRAALETELRRAAGEALDIIRPRGLLAGPTEVQGTRRDLVLDLLEQTIERELERVRERMAQAAAGGPPLASAIDAALARFAAYARGLFAGGAVDGLIRQEAIARLDRRALERAFARAVPDPEPELLTPLAVAIDAAFAQAHAHAARQSARAEVLAAAHEERVTRPLAALAGAIAALPPANDR